MTNQVEAVQKQYRDGAKAFAEKVESSYVNRDYKGGRDIEEAFFGLPSSFRFMRDLNKSVHESIDNMPLTVAERDELVAVAKEAEREARKAVQAAYNDASAVLEKKAKQIAFDQQYFDSEFRNLSSGTKEKILELAWAEAYERSHAEGFSAVMTTFSEVMDFAENVVKAVSQKGGEA